MLPIGNNPSLAPPPGALRRQVGVELQEMERVLDSSGLQDTMTRELRGWHERFVAALRSSRDEGAVVNAFIGLLQELLTDPVTGAPIDEAAVLGSDGYTYGKMSLAVHVLSVPESFRKRSPMDMSNPAPFTITPHPVVRHLIGWLERHNAKLYSEELEAAYLRLLPQQRPLDVDERIDRIIARQDELDLAEERSLREFEGRLERLGAQDQVDMARLGESLDAAAEPLRQAQGTIEDLALRIETFVRETGRQIEGMAEVDAEAMAQFQLMVEGVREEIRRLDLENEALKARQRTLSTEIDLARQQEDSLQKSIAETRLAVQKMKERSSSGLLSALVTIGVCVFTTWAIKAVLETSNIVIFPAVGGATLNVKIPIK